MGLNWAPCTIGRIPPGAVIENCRRRLVVWEATANCNYNCKHCYYKEQLGNQPKELNTDEILTALKGAADCGFTGLQILGGEPLLRKDMFQVFEQAKKFGYTYFQINSNGALINSESAQKLSDLNVCVLISVDGPKEINDSTRGRGSFDNAISAIEQLAKHNGKVEAYTVVTRKVASLSACELEAFFKKLADSGISCITFGKLTTEHLPEILSLMPSKEKLLDFATMLVENRGKWETELKIEIDEDEGVTFPFYWKNFMAGKELPQEFSKLFKSEPVECGVIGCTAGRENVIIDPEGNVLDCVFLRQKYGNVREKPFKEILSRLVSEYTEPYPACSSCRYKKMCGGTCRLLEMNKLLSNQNFKSQKDKVEEYIFQLTSC